MEQSKLARMGIVLYSLTFAVAVAATPETPANNVLLQRAALAPAYPARVMLQSVARAGARLVAVGEHGAVILSDDHGATWRAARSVPVDVTLVRVKFANARTGWAIGHMGVVLRTDDGGTTWSKQLDGVRAAQIALAQAEAAQGASPAAQQRALAEARALVADGPDKPMLDILVEDERRVSVVGAFNTAYRSEDGGKTWSAIAPAMDNPKGYHLYGIARTANTSFAVGEAGLVLRSAAPGAPYQPVALPYDGSMFGVLQPAPQQVLLYGLNGRTFRSADGGGSWTRSSMPGDVTVNDGTVLADGRIALGDQGGRVLLSRDGGASFVPVHKGGIPITGIAEAADGALVLATLRGVARIAPGVIQSSNGSKK